MKKKRHSTATNPLSRQTDVCLTSLESTFLQATYHSHITDSNDCISIRQHKPIEMRRLSNSTRHSIYRTTGNFISRLRQRKPLHLVEREVSTLIELRPRALNLIHLIAIGLGGTIGIGVFNKSGIAAAQFAGPAVIISFIFGGIIAMLSALSFAELSSMIATPGSAYTYTYVALGEYAAFFVSWSYIAYYQFAASTVVVAWSEYLVDFIDLVSDHNATKYIVQSPIIWSDTQDKFVVTGQIINLPAIGISILITIVLLIGIRETSMTNLVLVILKLVILLIFIFAACVYVNRDNYQPFIPSNQGGFQNFGFTGVLHATTFTFFAYNGFESITPVTSEAKKPATYMPWSIIITLIITFIFYIAVTTVLVGLVPYAKFNDGIPFVIAAKATKYGVWFTALLEIGAMCSLFTVALTMLLSQTRIFYVMSHDGLLPSCMGKVHRKWKTPWVSTLICGVVCAIMSGVCPVDIIGEGASLAILIIYIMVHVCVIVMRYSHENGSRGFSVPFGPFVIPIVGSLLCLLMVIDSTRGTFIRYAIWMGIGHIYYFVYGYRSSKLGQRYKEDINNISIFMMSQQINTISQTIEMNHSRSETLNSNV